MTCCVSTFAMATELQNLGRNRNRNSGGRDILETTKKYLDTEAN